MIPSISPEFSERIARLRRRAPGDPSELLARAYYDRAAEIVSRSVVRQGAPPPWTRTLDALLCSRWLGVPIMFALLAAVFWITIEGANAPSALLAGGLFWVGDQLAAAFDWAGAPWWLTGFLVKGIYRGLAWVVAVMLPPMAIFFPCFTLLEDFGYLPRVAFNLDGLLRRAGAHGKQALSMAMGFGCNAAGVIACRVIDSPRERLIAILTNTFMPCNGRFPTLIMLSVIFVGGAAPAGWVSAAAAGAIVGLVLMGVLFTLIVSAVLSKSLLAGERSTFSMELPPYRRPQILRVLYTSLIDRTIFVLLRAISIAAPVGGLIWLMGNVEAGGASLMSHAAGALQGFGAALGMDGYILLAFIIALPANEVVVPALVMAYLSADSLLELDSLDAMRALLVEKHGWTLLTAVCTMVFSVLHFPCGTTLWTIHRETGRAKWAWLGFLIPTLLAIATTFLIAQSVRFFSG
ncbi:MAG: nucleoside recognition domain-containing protein [bacterium]